MKFTWLRKHLQYASYLFRHRWYVLIECWGRGLYWRGLVHDLSKFRPSEWGPYADYFYGRKVRGKTGYYKPTDTGHAGFDFAWLLHQKQNDHHWQWWVLPEDEGGTKVLEMSEAARREMLCDWLGASRAQGHGGIAGVRKWYRENQSKMQLHPQTEYWLVKELFHV